MDAVMFYGIVLLLIIVFLVQGHRGSGTRQDGEDTRPGWRGAAAMLAAMGAMFVVNVLILDPLLDGYDGWTNTRWVVTAVLTISAGVLAGRRVERYLEGRSGTNSGMNGSGGL